MRNLCQFCANWKGERCRMWSVKQFECFWMYSFNLRLSYKYGNSFEHLKAFLRSCNLCSSSSTLSYAKYTVNVMPHSVAKSLRGSLNLFAAPWRKCPPFLLHASCPTPGHALKAPKNVVASLLAAEVPGGRHVCHLCTTTATATELKDSNNNNSAKRKQQQWEEERKQQLD